VNRPDVYSIITEGHRAVVDSLSALGVGLATETDLVVLR